ncbi:MAG: MerC domain-containing protein [Porticoccaceae bacterium]
MKNIQTLSDKTAISLSIICALHCLALPSLLVMLPSLTALNLADEVVHLWMLAAVIPISIYALTMGCRKHKRLGIVALGLVGITTLIAAALLGHDVLGETGEKIIVTTGAFIIAISHWQNHQLCRRLDCECHS